MKLIIISGLPGSGKSTKAKEILFSDDTASTRHVEADMFHTIGTVYNFDPKYVGDSHQWCQSQVAYHLRRGHNVIVSNTFTKRWEFMPYIDLAQRYDATVEHIHMDGDWGNIHNVPQEVLDAMKKRQQVINIDDLLKEV